MLFDPKGDAERTILEEFEQGIPRLWVTRKQIHCLREHRFTDEQGRVEVLDALGDPVVVLFRPIEKSDERSRINDGGAHCGRSLRDAGDSKRGRVFQNRWLRGPASSARPSSDSGASCAGLQAQAATPPRSGP